MRIKKYKIFNNEYNSIIFTVNTLSFTQFLPRTLIMYRRWFSAIGSSLMTNADLCYRMTHFCAIVNIIIHQILCQKSSHKGVTGSIKVYNILLLQRRYRYSLDRVIMCNQRWMRPTCNYNPSLLC